MFILKRLVSSWFNFFFFLGGGNLVYTSIAGMIRESGSIDINVEDTGYYGYKSTGYGTWY